MNEPTHIFKAPSSPGSLPRLPAPGAAPADEGWQDSLHRFHAGELAGDMVEALRAGQVLPAMLHPYRDAAHVRTAYPLVLGSPQAGVRSLTDQLGQLVEGFAPGDDEARLLKDNLDRLELQLRDQLQGTQQPAGMALDAAGKQLSESLDLKDDPARKLQQELFCLVDAVPTEARLLPLGPDTSLQLLLHAAQHALLARRAEHAARLDALRRRIRQRLDVEARHAPERRTGAAVAGSVGAVGSSFFDPAALAKVVDRRRGSRSMAPERLARLQECLDALDAFDLDSLPLVTVVHAPDRTPPQVAGASFVSAEEPLVAAAHRYEAHAATLVDVLRAERVAGLELDEAYDPDHHEAVLARLDWTAMSRDELLLVPTVVALVSGQALTGARLGALAGLLSGGRPVQVLVEVNPAVDSLAGGPALGGSRLELAQLAMALREPMVHQASVTRPQDMVEGFELALTSPRPGLHLVVAPPTGGAGARLGTWFHAEAAVESRAHPLLRYQPDLGLAYAARLDASGNPAPTQAWSGDSLAVQGASGEESLELSFTYADFALLEPALAAHFHRLPDGADSGELVLLADWLALEADAALRRIPWIWAVDDDDQLLRLALSRRLAFACRDRQEAWCSLQELAGLASAHVDTAVAAVRSELEQAHAAELDALVSAHAAEVEQAREEAAGEALGRLADALVQPELDLVGAAMATGATARPAAAPVAAAASEDAPAAEPAAAPAEVDEDDDEDMLLGDPWIDSILCSSCNDCLQVNPLMFVYNGNKQATIGDANAGTFEELVRAAEKCPSRCIHPGKPVHADEANLDDLVQRAAAFQ